MEFCSTSPTGAAFVVGIVVVGWITWSGDIKLLLITKRHFNYTEKMGDADGDGCLFSNLRGKNDSFETYSFNIISLCWLSTGNEEAECFRRSRWRWCRNGQWLRGRCGQRNIRLRRWFGSRQDWGARWVVWEGKKVLNMIGINTTVLRPS